MWPDEKLAAEMLADIGLVEAAHMQHAHLHTCNVLDVCCHVRALLERVRALEAEATARKEIDITLLPLLKEAHKDFCSANCPHSWTTGTPRPHCKQCRALSVAIAAAKKAC